jgi:hypothetical protein
LGSGQRMRLGFQTCCVIYLLCLIQFRHALLESKHTR